MINITSYVLYNLSNLLFALLIPEYFIKNYFINYSIASGIFTLIVFYNFSKEQILSEKYLVIFSVFCIFLLEIIETDIGIIWLFTLLIIYSDYFFSQSKNYLLNFYFKFLLFVLSLFLYEEIMNPILVLKLKIFLVLITLAIYNIFFEKTPLIPLNLTSPVKYNISTCLIYFFSLFLIPLITPDNFIKEIYISFQILIGIQLKIFDLKIRSLNFKILNLNAIFLFISVIFISYLMIYLSLYQIVILYVFLIISLSLLKRKYIGK